MARILLADDDAATRNLIERALAGADEIDRARHLEPKVARVVAKPITLEGIRAAVRAALNQ
jgi:CheY-like chemotaxis protein